MAQYQVISTQITLISLNLTQLLAHQYAKVNTTWPIFQMQAHCKGVWGHQILVHGGTYLQVAPTTCKVVHAPAARSAVGHCVAVIISINTTFIIIITTHDTINSNTIIAINNNSTIISNNCVTIIIINIYRVTINSNNYNATIINTKNRAPFRVLHLLVRSTSRYQQQHAAASSDTTRGSIFTTRGSIHTTISSINNITGCNIYTTISDSNIKWGNITTHSIISTIHSTISTIISTNISYTNIITINYSTIIATNISNIRVSTNNYSIITANININNIGVNNIIINSRVNNINATDISNNIIITDIIIIIRVIINNDTIIKIMKIVRNTVLHAKLGFLKITEILKITQLQLIFTSKRPFFGLFWAKIGYFGVKLSKNKQIQGEIKQIQGVLAVSWTFSLF